MAPMPRARSALRAQPAVPQPLASVGSSSPHPVGDKEASFWSSLWGPPLPPTSSSTSSWSPSPRHSEPVGPLWSSPCSSPSTSSWSPPSTSSSTPPSTSPSTSSWSPPSTSSSTPPSTSSSTPPSTLPSTSSWSPPSTSSSTPPSTLPSTSSWSSPSTSSSTSSWSPGRPLTELPSGSSQAHFAPGIRALPFGPHPLPGGSKHVPGPVASPEQNSRGQGGYSPWRMGLGSHGLGAEAQNGAGCLRRCEGAAVRSLSSEQHCRGQGTVGYSLWRMAFSRDSFGTEAQNGADRLRRCEGAALRSLSAGPVPVHAEDRDAAGACELAREARGDTDHCYYDHHSLSDRCYRTLSAHYYHTLTAIPSIPSLTTLRPLPSLSGLRFSSSLFSLHSLHSLPSPFSLTSLSSLSSLPSVTSLTSLPSLPTPVKTLNRPFSASASALRQSEGGEPRERSPGRTARSLAEAAARPTEVEELLLRGSPDLVCHNLMCEKVGDPCICRLSAVLAKLTNLRKLDLSNNRLTSLPEGLVNLSTLRELNISGNPIEAVPREVLDLPNLTLQR